MSQFLLLILEDTKPQTVPGLLGLLRSPPDGRRQYLSPVKSSAESFDQDDLLSTPSREDLTNPPPSVTQPNKLIRILLPKLAPLRLWIFLWVDENLHFYR